MKKKTSIYVDTRTIETFQSLHVSVGKLLDLLVTEEYSIILNVLASKIKK